MPAEELVQLAHDRWKKRCQCADNMSAIVCLLESNSSTDVDEIIFDDMNGEISKASNVTSQSTSELSTSSLQLKPKTEESDDACADENPNDILQERSEWGIGVEGFYASLSESRDSKSAVVEPGAKKRQQSALSALNRRKVKFEFHKRVGSRIGKNSKSTVVEPSAKKRQQRALSSPCRRKVKLDVHKRVGTRIRKLKM
jgi:CCR4-NOT transcriptional regulation complex NOT5 subunit